jgi:sensor domain CHASE-containing protein
MKTFKITWISITLIVALTVGFFSCSSTVLNPKRNKREQQNQRSKIAKKKRTEFNKPH